MGIASLWEDLEAKLLAPGQLLGYPWIVWGITIQTSYWEGRWHQDWVRSRPTNFFYQSDMEICEKRKFFTLWPPARKRREILWWAIKGEKAVILRGTNEKWLRALFDSVLPARRREMPVERELPAKLGRCWKKLGEIIHLFLELIPLREFSKCHLGSSLEGIYSKKDV